MALIVVSYLFLAIYILFLPFLHVSEVIGAIVSVVLIWVVTGILVYLAVQRVIHHNYHIHADEMLITAGCGVAFNIM